MSKHSKRTPIILMCSFTSIFLYCWYNVNPENHVSYEDLPTEIMAPKIQIDKLSQENNISSSSVNDIEIERHFSPIDENQDSINQLTVNKSLKNKITLSTNQDIKRTLNSIEFSNGDAKITNSRQQDRYHHETKPEELDIIIFNNKVYHKNDTLPQRPMKFPILRASGGRFFEKYDFKSHKPKDRHFLQERAEVMIKRAKKIARVCRERSMMAISMQLNLVWDLKHKVLWCPISKVAASSWKTNFLRLAQFKEDSKMENKKSKLNDFKRIQNQGSKHNRVFELYRPPQDREEWNKAFRSSLRMIIVRHPFIRILSIYQDKMLQLDPRPWHMNFRELQLRIITKYRPIDSPETSSFPTFSEFVDYVIDSSNKLLSARDWVQNDYSWAPYWATCNICGADYNVIMKLETIEKDEQFLITLTDMKGIKKLKTEEWKDLNTNLTSAQVVQQYYSQLSVPQIHHLRQVFRLDFTMFGYNINDVIKDQGEENYDESV